MERYYLLIFNNTHEAMKAESYLKTQGIKIRIMPTPTYITHSCGISIRVLEEDVEKIKELVNENSIQVKGIYVKDEYGFKVL